MTRADILAAMARFDTAYANTNDYDSWLDKANYTKAVEYNGRLYPCKWLVAEVMKVPTPELNTNNDAVPVLESLGFKVVPKP